MSAFRYIDWLKGRLRTPTEFSDELLLDSGYFIDDTPSNEMSGKFV